MDMNGRVPRIWNGIKAVILQADNISKECVSLWSAGYFVHHSVTVRKKLLDPQIKLSPFTFQALRKNYPARLGDVISTRSYKISTCDFIYHAVLPQSGGAGDRYVSLIFNRKFKSQIFKSKGNPKMIKLKRPLKLVQEYRKNLFS